MTSQASTASPMTRSQPGLSCPDPEVSGVSVVVVGDDMAVSLGVALHAPPHPRGGRFPDSSVDWRCLHAAYLLTNRGAGDPGLPDVGRPGQRERLGQRVVGRLG